MWVVVHGAPGENHRLLHLESGASITVQALDDSRFVLVYSIRSGSAGSDTQQLAAFDSLESAESELGRLGKDLSARRVPTETRFGRSG